MHHTSPWAPRKHGQCTCRDYEDYSHPDPEFMEIFMDILARLALAKDKADSLKTQITSLQTDSAAKDGQIADLQKQVADLNAASSTASAGKVDIAAVTPLVDDLIGPDPDLAQPAAPVPPAAPADAAPAQS